MNIRIAAVLVGGALALAGAVACGGGATPDPTPSTTTAPVTRPPTSKPPTNPTSPAPSTTPPIIIGAEQRNATQTAQEYLASGQSFSRKGFIRQLSSKAGEGYSVKAATAAVDSLHLNYNEQAALTAKNYLTTQAFSRSGLIAQLESGAEGFTHAQAVYGVKAAGL